MIINFGFNNFFSFKEGGEISFSLDKRVLDSVPNKDGVGYVMGIKGANSSGKTNVIRALSFLFNFASNSSDRNIDQKLKYDPFFGSEENSEFYIDFIANGFLYTYSCEVNQDKVFYEKLTRKIKREVVVFHRVGDVIEECLADLNEIKSIKLRNNASVISMLDKFKFESKMVDLNNAKVFFSRIVCNVGYAGLSDATMSNNISSMSKVYYDSPQVFSFAKDILKSADSSITDIEIFKGKKNENGEDSYFPLFTHKYCGKSHDLIYLDESNGTQALFHKMAMYWAVLHTGGVLALDEFDIHLHAMLLPKIVSLFESEDTNNLGAQFLFTAHNTEIMDYLGKYRTILVDKNNLESYCYRLDEMPSTLVPNLTLRTDRKLSGLYLRKKLGGVPDL